MVVHYRMLSALLAASLLASPAAQAVETGQLALPQESTALFAEAPQTGTEDDGVQLILPQLQAVAAELQTGEEDVPKQSADVTGKIEVSLRLDFDQPTAVLNNRNVTATLKSDDISYSATVELGKAEETPTGKYGLVRRTSETGIDYIDMLFENLSCGTYTLTFTGDGYQTYTKELNLDTYSYNVTVGTGDASFTLGDVTSDEKVTDDDLKKISEAIEQGTNDTAYDFNGDGKVDVTDFAYVDHCVNAVNAAKEANVSETAVITNTSTLEQPVLKPGNGTTETEKDGFYQFAADENGEIQFSAELNQAVEVGYINLVTSSTAGTIRDGILEIEYSEDGKDKTAEIPFKNGIPDGVLPMDQSGDESRQTIQIDLGKRVAVKKVTITVTQTATGEFASVAAIEFLEDIVPENPMPQYVKVQNLTADPGHESVALKWGALPNITGYEVVSYLTDSNTSSKQTVIVTDTSATVSGLTNNKEYTFEVTPVSTNAAGAVTWRGTPVSVKATPQANQVPAKINMVTVTSRDAQLDVSWKAGKNASTYDVYYSKNENAALNTWTHAVSGVTTTSASITGLQNDVTYYIYVSASNNIGAGPASNIVSGTPKKVEYEKPAGIPNDEALLERSKIASIRLVDATNVDAGTTFSPEYLIDNNYQTSWTAKDWWHNEHIECTFTEPVSLSAAIWVPRLDGDYSKWLRAYCVRVWTDEAHGGLDGALLVPDPVGGGVDRGALGNDSDMQTWPSVRGAPSANHFAVLPFGPLEGITKIQVAVEQAAYNRVSLSELMFLKYDPETDVPTLIDGLFADAAFTTLKSGVQESEIDRIEALLDAHEDYYLYPDAHRDELALARKLLAEQESDGVVLNGLHSTYETANYGQGGSTLQPLGVSANAGQTISIYANIPTGAVVNVYASQANAEANAWQASLGTLTAGRNVLTIPKIGSQASNSGGSLYYTCTTAKAENITLHVRRATDIPVLDVVNWYTMSDEARNTEISRYLTELKSYVATQNLSNAAANNPKNVTEISTPSVLLSIPASSVKDTTEEQLRNSVLAWEDVLYICKTTQGIDAVRERSLEMAERQNIRCMQMFEGAFMYAAGNHVGIGAGSCSGMVSGTPVPTNGLSPDTAYNGLFGWGIAHEIGHNMDKIGRAEISNNIYSLMVQTYDGQQNILTSRLESSNKYPAIFTKVARAYPGASNDVFVQLGMYWQLHLAYDEGDKPMDFYNRFFTSWKAGTNFGAATTTDEKIAVIASQTADRDLTDFFEHWGMTLSDAVKNELAKLEKEDRAIWYLSDQSRRERLASETPVTTGSITVTASVDSETGKDVTLTIKPSISGEVQGYEIRRNGAAIDFVVPAEGGVTTYTDHIGAANHTTYKYQVVAYNMQGGNICQADSEEIRIAYDMTVDPNEYTITRADDGKVTVTFKSATAVSGLKLLDWDTAAVAEDGEYTVTATVKDGDTTREVVARSDTFSTPTIPTTEGCYLTYFNKPGASSEDTRIGTYDALELKITGIPEKFPLEKIGLVSYAGDEIALGINGAVAGILKKAYGDIPAGSIVIVGTYRGNPIYNVPTVQGKFVRTYNDESGNVQTETTERDLDGNVYVFAEIPEDGEVSDISDGIFLYVLNVDKEKELQTVINGENVSHCDGVNLLPSQVRAVMIRTDMPDTTDSSRETATTLWIDTPGGDELPYIELDGEVMP